MRTKRSVSLSWGTERRPRVLTEHRKPISVGSSVADGVGDGVTVQAVRQRGARQERLHEGSAALPLQGVRAQLHRHPAARDAAAGQGHGGGALPERPLVEPHPQAAGGVLPPPDDPDQAVLQNITPKYLTGG